MASILHVIAAADALDGDEFTVRDLNEYMGIDGNKEGKSTSTLLNELCKRGLVDKVSREKNVVTYRANPNGTLAQQHQSWLEVAKDKRYPPDRPVRVSKSNPIAIPQFPLATWRSKGTPSDPPRFARGGL